MITIFTLSEAEYVSLAAIVRALIPIQLGSEKLCSRDVTLHSAEGVFSFIIEELHGQNSAVSLKLKEALMSRLDESRQKTLIGLEKYTNNGEEHSRESRSSGRCDTNLGALPAKSVPLSAAKRLLIRLDDENGDEMFALPIPKKESLSLSLSLSQSTKIKAERQRYSRN